jgi:hypothetical protein
MRDRGKEKEREEVVGEGAVLTSTMSDSHHCLLSRV